MSGGKPTIEKILRTLAENNGINLTAVDIGDRLKEEWRKNNTGGCKMISSGDACECHLCLIEKLVLMTYDIDT